MWHEAVSREIETEFSVLYDLPWNAIEDAMWLHLLVGRERAARSRKPWRWCKRNPERERARKQLAYYSDLEASRAKSRDSSRVRRRIRELGMTPEQARTAPKMKPGRRATERPPGSCRRCCRPAAVKNGKTLSRCAYHLEKERQYAAGPKRSGVQS